MKKSFAPYPSRRSRQRQTDRVSDDTILLQPIGDLLDTVLQTIGASPERARLCALWQNWDFVMGPELAPLAYPLGQHKGTLLIGAEDSMLMQELHMQSDEILERVNAFMDGQFFTSVRLSLVLDKKVLNKPRPIVPPSPFAQERGATLHGRYLKDMAVDSPVARCYALFVRKAGR